MIIILYKNSSEINRVDKTNYLTEVTRIQGTLREETSITELSITFEYNSVPTFNYVYIPDFNRYYFVSDISSVTDKLWHMLLQVDVLMTYKNALLNCTGFIDRNEFQTNEYIVDTKIVMEQGYVVESEAVTNELFTVSPYGFYILCGLNVQATPENN